MELFGGITLEGILSATIRMAAPLLFASMGGMFSAKSGIISLSLEGFMLIGAFCGFCGSVFTGSAYMGVLFAMLGGICIALVLGFLAITAKADQTIVGISINIFSLGITSYLPHYGLGLVTGPMTLPHLKTFPYLF